MNLPLITVVGNLVDDVELRFTPGGHALAKFRIASTERKRQQDGSYQDGDSTFLSCTVWRQSAENAAESLTRGMRVIVTGRLKQRDWDDKDGNKRASYEVDVDEVGPSLRNATAKVAKVARSSGGNFAESQVPQNDPWATSATTDAFGGSNAEPPF